jgi:hypothetical protein
MLLKELLSLHLRAKAATMNRMTPTKELRRR